MALLRLPLLLSTSAYNRIHRQELQDYFYSRTYLVILMPQMLGPRQPLPGVIRACRQLLTVQGPEVFYEQLFQEVPWFADTNDLRASLRSVARECVVLAGASSTFAALGHNLHATCPLVLVSPLTFSRVDLVQKLLGKDLLAAMKDPILTEAETLGA